MVTPPLHPPTPAEVFTELKKADGFVFHSFFSWFSLFYGLFFKGLFEESKFGVRIEYKQRLGLQVYFGCLDLLGLG